MNLKQKLIDYKNKNLMTESISFKEQMGYVGGSFGHGMSQDCVSTYGEKFQRDFIGIDNTQMLIKDNITTIAGFFIPPVAGAFYDSLNSKRSNINLGLKLSPIPFAFASLMLFIVPTTGNTTEKKLFNLVWVIFFTLLFYIGESFYGIAMNVLALKMLQKNQKDRKNFYTFSSLAATVGSMLPGWILSILVKPVKYTPWERRMYLFVALGFGMIGFIFLYAPTVKIDMTKSIFFQPANASSFEPEKPTEKVHWNRKNISLILHNHPFIIVQLATLCEAVRKIAFDNLFFLYDNVFENSDMKAVIDMLSGALSYVGLFIFPVLCSKISAPKIAAGGYSYSALFYLIISLFNVGSIGGSKGFVGDHSVVLQSLRRKRWLIGLLIGFSGMPNNAQNTAKNIVVADSTDYMEWYAEKKYGEPLRSDGLLLAAQGLMGKINDLVKKNLSGILFALIGFREGNEGKSAIQSHATLRGIYAMVSICAFAGNLLAAICFMSDRYTGKRQKKILEELAEFRKARAALEEEMLMEPAAT